MIFCVFMIAGCVKAEDNLLADTPEQSPAVSAMADKLAADFMEQTETVRRIDATVSDHTKQLADIKELLETKQASVPETPPAKSSTAGWRDNALLKQPGPTWNWDGDWNPTVAEAEEHLKSHGIEVSGFALHELKTIHDNIHNGYGYLYGLGTVSTVSTSSCPGGVCPTPQTRRRR